MLSKAEPVPTWLHLHLPTYLDHVGTVLLSKNILSPETHNKIPLINLLYFLDVFKILINSKKL